MVDSGVSSGASLTFQIRRVLVDVIHSGFVADRMGWIFRYDIPRVY